MLSKNSIVFFLTTKFDNSLAEFSSIIINQLPNDKDAKAKLRLVIKSRRVTHKASGIYTNGYCIQDTDVAGNSKQGHFPALLGISSRTRLTLFFRHIFIQEKMCWIFLFIGPSLPVIIFTLVTRLTLAGFLQRRRNRAMPKSIVYFLTYYIPICKDWRTGK